ncbi:hypothetical protein [Enterococcus faecium]|uniref:hypothetical protein n=1 Tax=Enterococcus faecium TaxID=1352 RepID=UPI0019124860|nr:hypothetical protein [Enterococcus faecium]MBK5028562.1 hypothetical protein [Enterococcus faecium]MBK5039265.1 hypothetical protein [Enterococcus faecium]MBK5044206.1 hypothetical protein [Enterococcus faecium]MBK5069129.1 hypothetical protein [Enterococcus faecium]MBK5132565.1 hypothetical protein [Enterococcus faecium]
MTKLIQAKNKLERLQKEQELVCQSIRNEYSEIPLGQPNIIGRPNIYKQVNRYFDKSCQLMKEEKKQQDRVAMLEKEEKLKKENELLKDTHVVGKTAYATIGAKTSVNNLDYFKQKLVDLEQKNEDAKAYNKTKPPIKKKTYGAEITKLKRKIAYLEEMIEKDQKKVLSEKTQQLIDSGVVKQWQKKPIYYFVQGLRKVALEIDEKGNFYPSERYPAYTESEKQFVKELLK